MSNKNNIIDLFKHLQNNYPEFKPVKGRPYGNASFNPRTKLSIVVKKSCVEVGFRTDGEKNDFSKDNFMKWANNSGILRTKCPNDDYFYLRDGVKNKNKVMVYTEIGYDNATDLDDIEFRLILTDVIKFLLEFVKKDFVLNIKKAAKAEPYPSENVVEETIVDSINEDVEIMEMQKFSLSENHIKHETSYKNVSVNLSKELFSLSDGAPIENDEIGDTIVSSNNDDNEFSLDDLIEVSNKELKKNERIQIEEVKEFNLI